MYEKAEVTGGSLQKLSYLYLLETEKDQIAVYNNNK